MRDGEGTMGRVIEFDPFPNVRTILANIETNYDDDAASYDNGSWDPPGDPRSK